MLGTFRFSFILSFDCCSRVSFSLLKWVFLLVGFAVFSASDCVPFWNTSLECCLGSLDGVKFGQFGAGPTIPVLTPKLTRLRLL